MWRLSLNNNPTKENKNGKRCPVSVGRVNAAGSEDALFLKVFAGEVLTSFERASVTAGAETVRTISNGKSATFPVMGRVAAAYHTPGRRNYRLRRKPQRESHYC